MNILQTNVFKSIFIFSQSWVKCFVFSVQMDLQHFIFARKNVSIRQIVEKIIIC